MDNKDIILEKFEWPAEEEMNLRVLREWLRIYSIKREVRLRIKSRVVLFVKLVLFV
jgi:hypothetical protein